MGKCRSFVAWTSFLMLLMPAWSARSEDLPFDDAGDLSIHVVDSAQMISPTSARTAFSAVSDYSGVRIQVVLYEALVRFDSIAESSHVECKPLDDGLLYPVIVRRVPGEPDATFFVRSGWVVSFETGKCFRAPPDIARLIRAAESL